MKKSSILSLPFFILLLFSCGSSKSINYKQQYPTINVNLKADLIIIEDKRGSISKKEELEIPLISKRGQYDIFVPPLRTEYEKIIRHIVGQNLSQKAVNSSILTVQLISAQKEFSDSGLKEVETSSVEIKLKIKINGKEIEVSEYGENLRKSLDANQKRSEKIFKHTLQEVTYNALQKLENKISS